MQRCTFQICLQCPGRFCELIAGDLEEAEFTVEDLVSQVLKELPSIAIVNKTEVDFFPSDNMYAFLIRISYYEKVKDASNDFEDIKLRVEGLVSQALLQLFWEVFLYDC